MLNSFQLCKDPKKLLRIIKKSNPDCVLEEVTEVLLGINVPGEIGHWFLVCVVLGEFAPSVISCKGFILDSSAVPSTGQAIDFAYQTLQQLVVKILQQPHTEGGVSAWQGAVLPEYHEFEILHVPKQKDGSSCGLHLLQNITHTLLGGLFDDLSMGSIQSKCTTRDIVSPALMRQQWGDIFRDLQSSVSARFQSDIIKAKLQQSASTEQSRTGHHFWRKLAALMMSWFSGHIVPTRVDTAKPWSESIIEYAKPGSWNTDVTDLIPDLLCFTDGVVFNIYSLLDDGNAKLVGTVESENSLHGSPSDHDETNEEEIETSESEPKPIMQLLRTNADTHYELIVEVNTLTHAAHHITI